MPPYHRNVKFIQTYAMAFPNRLPWTSGIESFYVTMKGSCIIYMWFHRPLYSATAAAPHLTYISYPCVFDVYTPSKRQHTKIVTATALLCHNASFTVLRSRDTNISGYYYCSEQPAAELRLWIVAGPDGYPPERPQLLALPPARGHNLCLWSSQHFPHHLHVLVPAGLYIVA